MTPDGTTKRPGSSKAERLFRKQYPSDYRFSAKRRAGVKAAAMRARQRNRAFVSTYLATHPCVDCGEADPVVLEFDHVRGEKRMDVGRMATSVGVGLVTLQAEIDKCEVRCANCHRRKTHQRRAVA
jgi:hypothetical protein